MIGFEALRGRLILHIKRRIQNGEVTERALALSAGISQPHLHNMLKGARSLTTGMGDQLLTRLGLSVLELVEPDELRRVLFIRAREAELSIEVPVLRDRLGPGLPSCHDSSPYELVRVPARLAACIPHPLVVRLAGDPEMSPYLDAGELVLLDNSQHTPGPGTADTLFAVEREGELVLRWVRQGRARLYLISHTCRDQPRRWEVSDKAILRAVAIPLRSIHKPELVHDPLLPRDKPQGPAPLSAAS